MSRAKIALNLVCHLYSKCFKLQITLLVNYPYLTYLQSAASSTIPPILCLYVASYYTLLVSSRLSLSKLSFHNMSNGSNVDTSACNLRTILYSTSISSNSFTSTSPNLDKNTFRCGICDNDAGNTLRSIHPWYGAKWSWYASSAALRGVIMAPPPPLFRPSISSSSFSSP